MRTPTDARGQEIRQFILTRVDEHAHDITSLTAQQFGLTRQAVHLHVQRLLADSDLVRQGKTRRTRFFLAPKKTWQKHYARKQSESDVWERDVLPQISDLPDNALDIWRYCFTEMFNNAVDHSSGTRITVPLKRTAVNVEIAIIDNGVGIPAENLTRIFNHGFTTRKDGHGFGLHSGALAARELGGALTVHSDGAGQGATFTIELPLSSN